MILNDLKILDQNNHLKKESLGSLYLCSPYLIPSKYTQDESSPLERNIKNNSDIIIKDETERDLS